MRLKGRPDSRPGAGYRRGGSAQSLCSTGRNGPRGSVGRTRGQISRRYSGVNQITSLLVTHFGAPIVNPFPDHGSRTPDPPSILSKAFDLLRAFNSNERVMTLTEL